MIFVSSTSIVYQQRYGNHFDVILFLFVFFFLEIHPLIQEHLRKLK